MDFRLRELRYFVAVAEELHFARAAARIGIHQSPLSKAITLMEHQLRIRLFIRTRRNTQLTQAGEQFLNDARRILAEVDRASRGIRAAARGLKGRLTIALAESVAHPRVATLLAQTRSEDPDADIHVRQMPFQDQLRALREGVVDIGLSLEAYDDAELNSFPLWKDTVVVALRPDSALANRTTIHPEELTEPLIVVAERSATNYELVADVFDNSLFRRESIECVTSIELLLTLVAAGYGIGLIGTARAETVRRPDLITRPLSARSVHLTTHLIHRTADVSKLIERFVGRAQKMR